MCGLSHFLPQPSNIVTQIYLTYLWHFVTLLKLYSAIADDPFALNHLDVSFITVNDISLQKSPELSQILHLICVFLVVWYQQRVCPSNLEYNTILYYCNAHWCLVCKNVQYPLVTFTRWCSLNIVQYPLMFSLVLVNGCPMVNGDLRGVGMTLYKGSNVECCPRGAAKVTEDNCVWHPPAPSAHHHLHLNSRRRKSALHPCCSAVQSNAKQCRAMQSNAVFDKCKRVQREQRYRLVH